MSSTRDLKFPICNNGSEMLIPSRIVPNSVTLSDEAKVYLHTSYNYFENAYGTLSKDDGEIRGETQLRLKGAGIFYRGLKHKTEYAKSQFDSRIEKVNLNGVAIDIVWPEKNMDKRNENKVVIHLCGGVQYFGGGVIHIAIFLSNIMGVKVCVPRDDSGSGASHAEHILNMASIYRRFLEKYEPTKIAVFGESSGASLAISLAECISKKNLPMFGALGLIGLGYKQGDSLQLNYALDPMILQAGMIMERLPTKNKANLSNEFGFDLSLLPPTILVTGTRDTSASGTIEFHRLLQQHNVEADLNIYEGMPHGHHSNCFMPEALEVFHELSCFFLEKMND